MQEIMKNKISNFTTDCWCYSKGTINEHGFVVIHAGGEGKKKKKATEGLIEDLGFYSVLLILMMAIRQ